MSTVSIRDIVARFDTIPTDTREQLAGALIQREEAMADTLRQAGMQFGLYPQIVAEVLAEVQMGEPIDSEQRALIRQQFAALMEQLQQQQGGGGQ